jgi:hypothetical protein
MPLIRNDEEPYDSMLTRSFGFAATARKTATLGTDGQNPPG